MKKVLSIIICCVATFSYAGENKTQKTTKPATATDGAVGGGGGGFGRGGAVGGGGGGFYMGDLFSSVDPRHWFTSTVSSSGGGY